MANAYISKVYLLDVPLENDYKNTLYFTSKAAQQSYFSSKQVKSFTDFSYQRKDNIIRVPDHIDNLYNCNYVMYQNTHYSNKWFYAFIKNMKYVNEGTTEFEIETDCLQTWLFDYEVKPSFVEREHVDNDDIGSHLVDEGLELGEYTCNEHTVDENLNEVLNDLCYIIATTKKTTEKSGEEGVLANADGRLYNGIFSGVHYYRLDVPANVVTMLKVYDEYGVGDCVTALFMAPKTLAPLEPVDRNNPDGAKTSSVIDSLLPATWTIGITKTANLNGYTPRNNKLKTYPFNCLMASNNQGSNVIYHYEDFSDGACYFNVKGALTPGCSIRMTPKNHKGCTENDIESINLGKFPTCNWTNDAYTNWLTQNSVNIGGMSIDSDQMNIGGSALSSIMQVAGGIGLLASGGGALAGAGMIANGLAGGVSGVSNALMQQKQHRIIPPQASGNLNAGDVITSSGKNTFHFYKMSIKKEFAERIDKFFDMFGYKVNMIKLPNKAHRSRWWYTKTIDVNIDGAIPMDDMNKIKSAYNNGITFWRNANEIQNYNLTNVIAITE